jgi:flagellar biosynthetic protein FliO
LIRKIASSIFDDDGLMDPARYIIAVLFVTALLLGAVWWLRRMNLVGVNSTGIRVLANQNVGTRERLLIVRFGDEDVLIGVTAHSITRLASIPARSSDNQEGAGGEPPVSITSTRHVSRGD